MTTDTPTSTASLTPPGARFAFNGILTSKRVCQEFLREFGIRRDWKNTSLAEMQALLKACSHERMFLAAQRMCERSGDDFIPQLYMVSGIDDEFEEASAPPASAQPKTSKTSTSKTEPDAPPADTLPAQPADAEPTDPTATASEASKPEPQATTDKAKGKGGKGGKEKGKGQASGQGQGEPPQQEQPRDADPPQTLPAEMSGDVPAEVPAEAPTRPAVEHKQFAKLVQACAAKLSDGHRLNIWLYGPPGTGKTSAARHAAQVLGLPFATTGALLTKYDITGFVSAQGTLIRSPFREIWEHGGVFLLDEIDGSDPRAIVAFNAALANAVMAFPDKMVERHRDCVMIAAANTAGQGATAEFNGRVKLDAASLDRFVMLDWPIDEAIEEALATDAQWLRTVQQVRANVAAAGIKGICISPRATFYGCALLAAGMPRQTVKEMVLKKGLSAEQWSVIC